MIVAMVGLRVAGPTLHHKKHLSCGDMMEISAHGILLDIEGTVASLHYVHEVLFPFARRHLEAFLLDNWHAESLRPVLEQIAADAGAPTFAEWSAGEDENSAQRHTIAQLCAWMDADVKLTGLKSLQGLIWQGGFTSGELRSQIYADVPPALADWSQRQIDVRIFSSGSVAAQKLFFAHTEAGNLSSYLRGYYDTTTGPKRVADSYERIAADFQLPTAEILFASDVVEELDAARQAGMQSLLLVRPGNPPVTEAHGHALIHSFEEVSIK